MGLLTRGLIAGGTALAGLIGHAVNKNNQENEAEKAARLKAEQEAAAARAEAEKQARLQAFAGSEAGKNFMSVMTPAGDKAGNVSMTLSDLQNMGMNYINTSTLAAQKDAYIKQQQLTETQRKYGMTGAVAAAQQQQFNLQAQQAIAQTQNEAALNWFNTAGGYMVELGQMKDERTASLGTAITQQVMNGTFAPGLIDQYRNTYGEDYANWDALANLGMMSQDEARAANDLLTQQNNFINEQRQNELESISGALGVLRGDGQQIEEADSNNLLGGALGGAAIGGLGSMAFKSMRPRALKNSLWGAGIGAAASLLGGNN